MMKWEKVKLDEVFSIRKGKKVEEIENGKFSYITIENLHSKENNKSTNDEGVFVEENDLLIAWDGANAGLVGGGFKGVIGSTLAQLKVKPKYEQKVVSGYCYRFLDSKFEFIKSKRTGATIPHVNGAELKVIQIPLPPLSTQQTIAAKLDQADRLRKKDLALLNRYDDLAQAIFIDLFGDPVRNEKGWEIEEGRKLFNISGGGVFKSSDYKDSGIPLIRIGTINKGYFDDNDIAYIPNDFEKNHSKYLVYPEDLLMTLTGTVGKDDYGNTFILENNFEKYFLNQRVAKFVLNEKKLVKHFFRFFLSQKSIKSKLTGVSRGVRQANISNDDLYSLVIILPPLPLQQKFASIIENIELQKQKVKAQAAKSEELFQALLQESFGD